MEVHQTAFIKAVALAGVVALTMTVWDREEAQVAGTPARKAEPRKDPVQLGAFAIPQARTDKAAHPLKTRASRDPIAR